MCFETRSRGLGKGMNADDVAFNDTSGSGSDSVGMRAFVGACD